MNYFYGNPAKGRTFIELLEMFPPAELTNLDRSTIPLLAFWAKPGNVNKLLAHLALGGPPVQTSFEYPVAARCGDCGSRGKASFTDVMIKGNGENGSWVVAIEAKHTEDLYVNIGKWKVSGKKDENRKSVLKHWWNLVNNKDCNSEPQGNEVNLDNIIYQMLHRTASACSLKATKTFVIHLLFLSDEKNQETTNENDGKIATYTEAIEDLAKVIPGGNSNVKLSIKPIWIKKTPFGDQINEQLKLETNEGARADLILKSLAGRKSLFKFKFPKSSN